MVLFIDDNEALASLAARILERTGLTTVTASDGAGAVAGLAAHADRIAVVVLDVTMPDITGDVLLGELLARGLVAPVVVSSGFGREEAMRGFDPSTVAGFLQKPYRGSELVEMVQSVLGPGDG